MPSHPPTKLGLFWAGKKNTLGQKKGYHGIDLINCSFVSESREQCCTWICNLFTKDKPLCINKSEPYDKSATFVTHFRTHCRNGDTPFLYFAHKGQKYYNYWNKICDFHFKKKLFIYTFYLKSIFGHIIYFEFIARNYRLFRCAWGPYYKKNEQ